MNLPLRLLLCSLVLNFIIAIYGSFESMVTSGAEMVDAGPLKIIWIFPLVILAIFFPRYLIIKNKLYLFICIAFFISFIIGCFNLLGAYYTQYVFGDLLKMFGFWFSFIISLSLLEDETKKSSIEQIYFYFLKWFILFGIIDAIITIYIGVKVGTKVHSLIYIYCLIYLIPSFYTSKNNGYNWFAFALSLLFLAAALYSGKRANVIIVILFLIVNFIIFVTRSSFSKVFVYSISLLYVGLFIFLLMVNFDLYNLNLDISGINAFQRLLSSILNGEGDDSYYSRILEVYNIVSYYEEHPLMLFFGAGLGATIPMIYDTSVYAPNGMMHHAHILWAVYMLRTGLFGSILILSFFANWFFKLFKSSFRFNSYFPFSLMLFVLVSSLSMKANMMINENAFLYAIAIFGLNKNEY